MTKATANKLIVSVLVLGLLMVLGSSNVFASDCESTYGGGETCVINKSFRIEKKVAVAKDDQDCDEINSDKFKDKVTGVEKNEEVCFRIKVKNTGELETDEMKMKDSLPDELDKIGGSGLTEEWDNFAPGKTKEFFIRVKVENDEFDNKNFEKCVVNKAEVTYKGKFEGSSSAVVCYSDETEIKELPKTGFDTASIMAALGSATTGLGLFVKKLTSKVRK